MNVFFIETPTGAVEHGVGSYAGSLLPELSKVENVCVYYVQVKFSEKGNIEKAKISDNYNIVKIEIENIIIQKKHEVAISPLTARAIFCILSPYLRKGASNIFHLNSLLQKSIADIAKEYAYSVVFTQHVSLWQVFYNNNKQKFEKDWSSTLPQINNSKFIRSIKLEQALCLISNKVVCLSEEGYAFTKKYYGLAEEKITLIRNGIALKKSNANVSEKETKLSLGYKQTDFIFLFVGRLIEQKGLSQLISAFKMLAKEISTVKLIIVGGGELVKFVNMAADCCGRISFTGYLEREKVDKYYNIASVGVMPSATEQSSFVVLEMLSKKFPTILSDIEAFNNFSDGEHVAKVKTNDNGYVYIDLLYKTMKHLVENKFYRERIAKNAFELLLENYQSSSMAKKTIGVYEKSLVENNDRYQFN